MPDRPCCKLPKAKRAANLINDHLGYVAYTYDEQLQSFAHHKKEGGGYLVTPNEVIAEAKRLKIRVP